MTSSDNCWISAGNYWVGWLDILLRDAETFLSGRKKWKKSKQSNWKNHEKSKKSKKSNFSKLLLWEKLGDIRNTMSSRKPGLVTRQLVSMSAFSAVRILPQMSAHDILRKNAHSIVEKCILVCVWFSKRGTVILWSECALLFPLIQDPSFSNRKAVVPTYPGKLVPGSIN